MASATMSGRWQDAVPLEFDMPGGNSSDSLNDRHRQDRNGSTGSRSASAAGYRETQSKQVGRKGSDMNIRNNERARRPSGTSASGAAVAGKKRSMKSMKQQSQSQPKLNADGSVDDSPWIHRDKLAAIEIQEMEQAGITIPGRQSVRPGSARAGSVGRRSRSQSRTRAGAARRAPSTEPASDSHSSGEEAQHGYYNNEGPQRKRISTIPDSASQPDEHDASFDPEVDSELRTPDEAAEEQYQPRSPSSHGMQRPNTSRIPVSRQSPMPVPHDVVERESPLPRSPQGSGSWDELQYARKARSSSVDSQSNGDGSKRTPPDSSHHKTSNERASPTKARTPNKAVPSSGGRKTSAKTNGPVPANRHNRSGSYSNKRPPSAGTSTSRPSTSRAPEGEAPWIAGMYKPDPRLPPDQQMLPTHAKKMMQAQWEKEGKSGTAYDRDLRLLNDNDPFNSNAPVLNLGNTLLDSNRTPKSPSANADPWPLSPTKSESKGDTGSRPGTSGGYKTTPTIKPSPQMPSPRPTGSPQHTQSQLPRMPDMDEKQDTKPKKACCCVVM